MFKTKLILIIVIVLAVLLSGCTGRTDVTPIVKALPEFQQFMKEHPTAKITVTYWSKDEVAKSIQEISYQCDKAITPVAMYKAAISEGDLKIVAWINAENQAVICSTTEGKQTTTPTPASTQGIIGVTPRITPFITPTPAPTVVISPAPATPAVTPVPTEGKFRVGPTVRLRPITDVIDANQDGIVELYMENPSLNDVKLTVEIRIAVPSGINVYGQGFGSAGAAGIVMGTFEIPPGIARTINVAIKADSSARIGSYSLQFIGLYYPGDNKDNYQPVSFTYNVYVKETSATSVEINGFAFNPATITISKGTTVTWTQKDSVIHTVTTDSFDSGRLGQGQTFSYTFNKAGTYDYHCSIHPSMKGKVVVT